MNEFLIALKNHLDSTLEIHECTGYRVSDIKSEGFKKSFKIGLQIHESFVFRGLESGVNTPLSAKKGYSYYTVSWTKDRTDILFSCDRDGILGVYLPLLYCAKDLKEFFILACHTGL